MNEEIRLDKYLDKMGVCPQWEADRLVEAGKVAVDGATASMGMKVKPGQRVVYEGRVVGQEPGNGGGKSARRGQGNDSGRDGSGADSVKYLPKVKPVLLVVSRPRGIICTASDKNRATNIAGFLGYPTGIYPVGRLDKGSEGLLLITSQGDLVNKVMRAGNVHEKEYVVTMDKPVTKGFLKAMREGMAILDTVTRSCKIRATGMREFTIILTQRLNRQIRRTCGVLGYQIRTLKRVQIMNLWLGSLKTGGYRKVMPTEYQQLLELLEGSNNISTEMEEHDDVEILIGKERLGGETDS